MEELEKLLVELEKRLQTDARAWSDKKWVLEQMAVATDGFKNGGKHIITEVRKAIARAKENPGN